jgi:Apea-like HEPN
MVSLNAKAKEYVDKLAAELLLEIFHEKIADDKKAQEKPQFQGYLKNKNFIELGEIVGNLDVLHEGADGKVAYKIRNFKDEKVGYYEEGFRRIYKIVDTFFKGSNFNRFISEKFLVDNVFEWLVDSYRHGQNETILTDFILKRSNESIRKFRIYIPVLYLESDKEFKIGDVSFAYITEDYIKNLSLSVELDKRQKYIESMLRHKGQLMGSCVIQAERGKAMEIGMDAIEFSTHLLKMVSPTVFFPDVKAYYDVDFKNMFQLKNDLLVQSIEEQSQFNLESRRRSLPFVITPQIWKLMIENGLELLHQFILNTATSKSELQLLICNAIKNYSRAISNHDLHERTTQIFTILESLLLPNDNAAIIDSVCKYLPKLVETESEARTEIVQKVKEMYKVRSSMIHHAKRKEFDIKDLAFLQICARSLIYKYIILSRTKVDKMEILREIDELINRA